MVDLASTHAPAPFIVGVGRSGTTLLRLMLDAHPELAITPETHWLGEAITTLNNSPASTEPLRHILISNSYCKDMGITHEELDTILAQHNPLKPFDTLRAIYTHYGDR